MIQIVEGAKKSVANFTEYSSNKMELVNHFIRNDDLWSTRIFIRESDYSIPLHIAI